MPIGTTAAIIGSAVIGAGATALSASKSAKAANKATQAQVDSNRESLALQREVRDENRGILSPFVNTGYAANNALAGLLGLPGTNADGTPGAVADPTAFRSAFDAYRTGTGYDFRVGEGMKAINSGLAAKGVLNSGAAVKSALSFGQGIASDEFQRYMAALTGQQQTGLSAGNALAGVGTNFANNATAINGQTASAIGNGALANASINNGFANSIAGIAGSTLGALSTYGSPTGASSGGTAGGVFGTYNTSGGGYGTVFNPHAFTMKYGIGT